MSVPGMEILIDELVIHGASGVDRDRYRAQVEQELGRLLSDEGGLAGLAESTAAPRAAPVHTVAAPAGQIPSPAQVARAIHGSLRGRGRG
ncbi:MAG TPA: hypothetical protein ENJ19_00415 [Gammaproteobacteria bacterium]|nr:hypothetical protein [Gammaproteobacteria bacterium]